MAINNDVDSLATVNQQPNTNTLTPASVLSDPDFHALPEIERLKVLYTIDPDYRHLHPRERWKVARLVSKVPVPPPIPSYSP